VRALVTGASGFVGPHLVAHLRAEGDDVVVTGDHTNSFDITDFDGVERSFRAAQPEVVYHLAARTHVGESWRDPQGFLRVNAIGTANVLQAAQAAGVQRVLVVGSAEEYGRADPHDLPLREDAPLRPLSPYAASKVAASYLALQACIGGGLETVRVRPFSHTGPGQAPSFFVPAMAARIVEAERRGFDAVGAGALDPVRDFSDVRDVVRAHRLLMINGVPGEVYNVCTGTGVSVGDIAQRLIALAQRPLRIDFDASLLRPVDLPVLVGDPTKLHAATGYEPRYPLAETLNDVLEDARQGS
jgi:GDP-4-dehydro-6-deoxy-D-mannose reductase